MKRNIRWGKIITAAALVTSMMFSLTGCGGKTILGNGSELDPDNPVTITVWNYYNGDQLTAFEKLVEEFNSTIGIEKGVVAVTVSQGDIDTLANSLLDSVDGKAGSQEKPTLAAVYAETAYILDKEDALSPLDPYFTEEELGKIVPGFLDEGRFNENNDLLLFPIIKSTELFTANETDWEPFAADTGIAFDSIKTKEDLTAAAKTYYEWTDAQTPDVAEDGKALYGRDSVANYIYLGCYQLGQNMFPIENGKLTVNMNRDAFKTLWDNYYIPFINGYFGAYAKFRSEDAKTGQILALTSSSSSVGYLPSEVTLADDSKHDISIYTAKDLQFANASVDAVVQQGASYCMLKSTPAQEEGAALFLKWFAEPEQNMAFAIESAYSPISLAANTEEAISKAYAGDVSTAKGQNVLNALLISADTFSNGTAYATKPFNGSKEVRTLLGNALNDIATKDRNAVVTAMEAGATREEAVAEFSTDEYFDAWFEDLSAQVTALVEE
ncbi:MAG: extracellular solute-binding protein [Lachnospiraceae bacterium]|nr:extracellular solute-binding protein [Lachnospiraceae bacterium]